MVENRQGMSRSSIVLNEFRSKLPDTLAQTCPVHYDLIAARLPHGSAILFSICDDLYSIVFHPHANYGCEHLSCIPQKMQFTARNI